MPGPRAELRVGRNERLFFHPVRMASRMSPDYAESSNLRIGSGCGHSRNIRHSPELGIVPERMPSDVCDSDLHRSRTDKTPHESLSPIRVFPERSGTSKYPVIWFLVRCTPAMSSALPPGKHREELVSAKPRSCTVQLLE